MSSWEEFARAEPEMAEKGLALLHQHGDGEGFLSTVAATGTPRIHPLNVGVRGGRLLVFIQAHSAKARDLAANRTTRCTPTWTERRRTSSCSGAGHVS